MPVTGNTRQYVRAICSLQAKGGERTVNMAASGIALARLSPLTLALLEVWPTGRICKAQLEPVLRQLAVEFHLFGPGGLDRRVDVTISEILVVMNHTMRLTNPLRWAPAIARLGDKEIAMLRAVFQKLGPRLAEE